MTAEQDKKPLFSVTRKDFRVDTFRSGGKGGQHQNTTDSGVRITHIASGAVGMSREERSQPANKKKALTRLANSSRFKAWARLHAAMISKGYKDVEQLVDKMMQPEYLKIEYLDDK